ncbi:dihydroorotase [Croceicoccus sp. F390]|uniref:Dihydroorotase n=1 Tax=Croceicoccus esteveae TaxID=3075597 RepID=A0ABU2ZG43_9SPHN|nr:dihydroorotase [Croceicoccus sp. F390]MDT0575561.1 dihydroorotase [Croceicoccus sp. F390]
MKPAPPLTITNGRLLCTDGISDAASPVVLLCQGDRIVGTSRQIDSGETSAAGHRVFDARGMVVMPGIVDLGVFEIDKPAFHFGGITRAALMPDQAPPLDYPARVRFAAAFGKPDLWVHPLAAATRGLAGTQLAEMALMKEAGARAVATGRSWIADSGVMLRVMQYAAMLDLPVITHAEDTGLAGDAVATAGEIATRLGLPAAPAEAEALAIARDLMLAAMSGVHLHIRQVTTRAGLDLVRKAKAGGTRVTCGVTPAHFMLSDIAMADFRTFARLSPPLRSEEDRQAVREALADGTIDVIASGHDPRGPEDKRLPFADAAPGMAGAETLLPLTLALVRDGLIGLPRVCALLCTNPATILGIAAGVLEKGYEADVAIVDVDRPWIVDSDRMQAQAGNTPFDRQPLQGRTAALFKGGMQVGQ